MHRNELPGVCVQIESKSILKYLKHFLFFFLDYGAVNLTSKYHGRKNFQGHHRKCKDSYHVQPLYDQNVFQEDSLYLSECSWMIFLSSLKV